MMRDAEFRALYPETWRTWRDLINERHRERMATDPAYVERRKANRRRLKRNFNREWLRLKADPVRYPKYLERQKKNTRAQRARRKAERAQSLGVPMTATITMPTSQIEEGALRGFAIGAGGSERTQQLQPQGAMQ